MLAQSVLGDPEFSLGSVFMMVIVYVVSVYTVIICRLSFVKQDENFVCNLHECYLVREVATAHTELHEVRMDVCLENTSLIAISQACQVD